VHELGLMDLWGSDFLYHHTIVKPHEKLLGIRRVSNPSTSIDPGSLKIGFLVLIQNTGFFRDNGTNYTNEGHRGRKPVSKKLLGWHHTRQASKIWQVLRLCGRTIPCPGHAAARTKILSVVSSNKLSVVIRYLTCKHDTTHTTLIQNLHLGLVLSIWFCL